MINKSYKIRKNIQNLFNNKIVLLANKVSPGGSETSNDRNTARFSENYRQSDRITGVNENLILIFYVILHSISSGFKLKN
jgi:hypothetical protein